ncbi:hypothetical protein E2C01_068018 [Portunus trituberculatus]|uniref:Uncharacterized protein n=1 Tax=Portunus trituberculatus TaxID=210409 RepID=A0A5B7HQW6_PORTR|nr:hypothetical protein [Portunus trituberculatus]
MLRGRWGLPRPPPPTRTMQPPTSLSAPRPTELPILQFLQQTRNQCPMCLPLLPLLHPLPCAPHCSSAPVPVCSTSSGGRRPKLINHHHRSPSMPRSLIREATTPPLNAWGRLRPH